MNADELIIAARAAAIAAHAGQTRRGGLPYYTHLSAVAARVPGALIPLAWLHDILEDTTVTVEDLQAIGIPHRIIDAVLFLTKDRGDGYDAYIDRLIASFNEDAITVKIADIEHNVTDTPSRKQQQRYLSALPRLRRALANIQQS